MKKPTLRDNIGRWEKYATIYITDALKEQAEAFDIGIKKVVKDQLQLTYVNNVRASYTPRTIKGQETAKYNKNPYNEHRKKVTYRHTGTFANSIYTKIEGKNIKVMIKDEIYPDGVSTTQVYEWLTKGTKGGNKPYPYVSHSGNNKSDPGSYRTGWSRNFPTPAHLFEEHTNVQMKGYLESLANELENGDIKTIQHKYRMYIRKRK